MVPGRLLGNPRLFHPKRFIPYPFQPAFNLWILCTLVLTLRSFGVRAEVVSAVISILLPLSFCRLVYA
ncbi:hypothetical protein FB106_1089 [Synechococcus sp. Ace-Pa]|nr:hypothetical protein FB106_1089 [Synechococcus sp. Ace-Pa]